MMRRPNRLEVQMLIDLAVELGDMNYITETPISTDLNINRLDAIHLSTISVQSMSLIFKEAHSPGKHDQ